MLLLNHHHYYRYIKENLTVHVRQKFVTILTFVIKQVISVVSLVPCVWEVLRSNFKAK
jgi:hypothetical protein